VVLLIPAVPHVELKLTWLKLTQRKKRRGEGRLELEPARLE